MSDSNSKATRLTPPELFFLLPARLFVAMDGFGEMWTTTSHFPSEFHAVRENMLYK
jgi:hypothetical protein